jgi:nicotinic acid phosphoribosyltransferase
MKERRLRKKKKKLLLLAMMYFLAHAKSSRRNRPTCWVRPWIKRRSQLGFSFTLARELAKEDLVEFHQMFRMDVKDYQWLLNNVTCRLTKCDTHAATSIARRKVTDHSPFPGYR